MLNIEDPEDVTNINTQAIFPTEKVTKDNVEVVPVTKADLLIEQKSQEKNRIQTKKHDAKTVSGERTFIKKKHGLTNKDIDKREVELEDLIKRKQERSR